MIDAILYGEGRHGRLIARERRFESFLGMVLHFKSLDATRWLWAEVVHAEPDGRTRHVRYPAEELRSMTVSVATAPNLN